MRLKDEHARSCRLRGGRGRALLLGWDLVQNYPATTTRISALAAAVANAALALCTTAATAAATHDREDKEDEYNTERKSDPRVKSPIKNGASSLHIPLLIVWRTGGVGQVIIRIWQSSA